VHRKIFTRSAVTASVNVPVPRIPGTSGAGAENRAPRRGEHTREILALLGLDEKQQRELFDSGAVSTYQSTSE
jgi:crotonobetainyl-CoA:carnitine CoA-transferase CaiB-like acyl-CoA transferase